MTEAPVIIFVVNILGKGILEELTPEEHIYEICNIQSISASVQNMLLAATENGRGAGMEDLMPTEKYMLDLKQWFQARCGFHITYLTVWHWRYEEAGCCPCSMWRV